MPDWTLDRTTDLTDPFILRRQGLNVLDAQIAAGGGGTGTGGRTVTFSQPAGAPAITGGSPKFIVPFAANVLNLVLAVVGAPSGTPLTVQFLKNSVVYATLQVLTDTTTTATLSTGLPSVVLGDELTVNATDVGDSVAAQGVTAMINLG